MGRSRDWPRTATALATGMATGVAAMVGGALLVYMGDRVLAGAGFIMALALLSFAAGLWVGSPDGPAPGHRRMVGRWIFAIGALVLASFVATFWITSPLFQTSPLGPPVAVVFLLAEPMYAMGALLAAIEARRRGWFERPGHGSVRDGHRGAGVVLPGLVGAAAGLLVTAGWLIPMLPPGPVLLGTALLMTAAASVEMAAGGTAHAKEAGMADRVVVVTGVGRRGQLGYAVARAFVDRGARVLVTGRSPEVEERARELGGDVIAVVADIAAPAGAEAVIDAVRERWARLDVLVNVAGGLTVTKPLAETSDEEWRREVESNATTAFVMTRAALPMLREAGGSVVNFASPAGERAVAGLGAYSAGKAGVIALTRALAREEEGAGVRVNAVAPGLVDTEENREAMSGGTGTGWTGKRVVTREQVVAVVMFLAAEASSGVNGEVVGVAGGRVS